MRLFEMIDRADMLCLPHGLAKINDLDFDRASNAERTVGGHFLLSSQKHQHSARSDDPEQKTSTRRAAEALFTPKRQVTEQPVPASVLPAEPSARKPRILRAVTPAPVRCEQAEAPASSEQQMTTEIPSSQFARIRRWVAYGMTAAQAAGVYGVAVGAIERILRQT
jgi:hypothetical protein